MGSHTLQVRLRPRQARWAPLSLHGAALVLIPVLGRFATVLRAFAGVVMNCDRHSKGAALFRQAKTILDMHVGHFNLIRARLYEDLSYWCVIGIVHSRVTGHTAPSVISHLT